MIQERRRADDEPPPVIHLCLALGYVAGLCLLILFALGVIS